ncbi:hypothetical protein AB6E53_02220 [Vibrio breoganii]|uniref:Uncharacterized protein n=1 Tax=Vibrio breoganii TaxID=553239 RepID=A0AAP8MWQ7_9VIBR|nr:hypothetical protein [Vibrio breoganii]PMP10203.1 hypothetical protein BCS93_11040 [Vibrio breoganii]
MGGSDNEIKETSAEKASAQVAKDQWALYENELKPFEENFIQRVQSLDSQQAKNAGKDAVSVGNNRAFSEAKGAVADQMTSAGVDPSSGKFQTAIQEVGADQAISQGDTMNRMETSIQDRKMAGLSDVVAMGDGEKGEAMSGMDAVASSSLRKATSDAYNSFNRSSANGQLAGAVVGAGANYATNNLATPNTAGMSDQSAGYSLRDNQMVNPQATTYFGGR